MKNTIVLKRILYLPVTFVLVSIMGFQCDKYPTDEPEYDFEIGVKITPEQEIYKVGDTIKLNYQIKDNSLFDNRTGKSILLGQTSIPFIIYFGVRSDESQSYSLPNKFVVKVNNALENLISLKENGQFSKLRYNLSCEETQGVFDAEIMCVPQESGIYKFEVWQEKEIYFSGMEDCSEYVTDQHYANLSYKFSVNNSNKKWMKESPLPPNHIIVGVDQTEQKTEEKRIYWIKVVD